MVETAPAAVPPARASPPTAPVGGTERRWGRPAAPGALSTDARFQARAWEWLHVQAILDAARLSSARADGPLGAVTVTVAEAGAPVVQGGVLTAEVRLHARPFGARPDEPARALRARYEYRRPRWTAGELLDGQSGTPLPAARQALAGR